MKNFIKACLIAVLVFVVAGIVLLVVAAAGGVTRASLRLLSEENRLNFGPLKVHIGDGFSVNLDRYLDDDQHRNQAGKYLINEEGEVVLLANGVYSLNKEVKELYVDVDTGDFTFLPSEDDYFYIENSDEKLSVNYVNGRLEIGCESDIHLIQIGFNQMEDVTIYVPSGVTFDAVTLDVDSGNVDMNMPLTTKRMTVDVDTGNITFDNEVEAAFLEIDVDAGDVEAYNKLKVTDRVDMDVDVGSIVIDQLDCYGAMEAECDTGNIEINGRAGIDVTALCDVGNITMNFAGDGSKYTYHIESSMGNVTINGNDYGGLEQDIIIPCEGPSAGTVKVSCDVGNVEIDIH